MLSEACLACYAGGVDSVEADPLARNLPANVGGEVLCETFAPLPRAVHEQRATRPQGAHDVVVAVEVARHVAGNKVCLPRPDLPVVQRQRPIAITFAGAVIAVAVTRQEAQVRDGHAACLVSVVLEDCLGVCSAATRSSHDLCSAFVCADRAVAPNAPKHTLKNFTIIFNWSLFGSVCEDGYCVVIIVIDVVRKANSEPLVRGIRPRELAEHSLCHRHRERVAANGVLPAHDRYCIETASRRQGRRHVEEEGVARRRGVSAPVEDSDAAHCRWECCEEGLGVPRAEEVDLHNADPLACAAPQRAGSKLHCLCVGAHCHDDSFCVRRACVLEECVPRVPCEARNGVHRCLDVTGNCTDAGTVRSCLLPEGLPPQHHAYAPRVRRA